MSGPSPICRNWAHGRLSCPAPEVSRFPKNMDPIMAHKLKANDSRKCRLRTTKMDLANFLPADVRHHQSPLMFLLTGPLHAACSCAFVQDTVQTATACQALGTLKRTKNEKSDSERVDPISWSYEVLLIRMWNCGTSRTQSQVIKSERNPPSRSARVSHGTDSFLWS